MDQFHTAPDANGSTLAIIYTFFSTGSYADYSFKLFAPTTGQTITDFEAAADAQAASYAAAHSYTIANIQKWYPLPSTISGFTSYQTLISQAGTAAPALSGAAAINGFPGTTFTWARTGVGVYTLTASAAVFTTNKTGVFISPLQNLNGAIRAVVTSTTVITITTAVQSLAVLGLLGFTTTNTDAMLSGTLVEVRVYP